jgi:proline dehydrogenase
MLRPVILALSRSRTAERIATHAPGFRGFSRRFVAGPARVDAIAAVRGLNAADFDATVSFLGEAVTSESKVAAAVEEFSAFAVATREQGLRSHISIKLTELGLAFDPALARRSLGLVLARAADAGTFVRIDMEDSRYTAATLEMFREARRTHENVGVVVQSYLRRSAQDIEMLAREGAPVRLVKGAYREPATVAFQSKQEVDDAYASMIDLYFGHMAPGGRLAVATHDGRMVRAAIRAAKAHAIGPEHVEFQFLYGIRVDLQRALRDGGHRVRIYVPYGGNWYPYLMRRLAERPANLWFFLRGALGR